MKLQLDNGDANYQIRSYQAQRCICVNQTEYTHSLVVSPNAVKKWAPQDFSALTPEDFADLLELQPRIVLFGSGASFRFPEPSLLSALYAAHVGVETMDTAAACRTYTVLAAEGRSVVAALLL